MHSNDFARATKVWRRIAMFSLLLACVPLDALSNSNTRSETTPPLAEDTQQSFEQRLESASRRFIGRTYLRSPLGEKSGVDPDPTIRFDAFDCTTYVETVIAVARSREPSTLPSELTRIRYSNGVIGFASRRHLPGFQWLPELIAGRILRDITQEVGGHETAILRKTMTPQIWQQRSRRIVRHLDAENVPSVTIELPYIPLAALPDALHGINEVAVINVVRKNRESQPLVITHQALLVPTDAGYRVRHARPYPANRVVDEALTVFIQRLHRFRNWPVVGLNIADVVEPSVTDGGTRL